MDSSDEFNHFVERLRPLAVSLAERRLAALQTTILTSSEPEDSPLGCCLRLAEAIVRLLSVLRASFDLTARARR